MLASPPAELSSGAETAFRISSDHQAMGQREQLLADGRLLQSTSATMVALLTTWRHVLLLPSLLIGAQTFVVPQFGFRLRTFRLSSAVADEDLERSLSTDIPSSPALAPNHEQFWLDLRSTALLPIEAMNFLDDQIALLQDDDADSKLISSMIDAVVLDEQTFVEMVKRDKEPDIDVYYTLEATGDLILSKRIDGQPQSIPSGQVLLGGDPKLMDPIAALETTEKGEWVLIDDWNCDDEAEITEMSEQVSSLAAFLSSASVPSTFSLAGLLMPSLSRSQGPHGGLAVTCRTQPALLAIQSALQKDNLATETDSGILIPGLVSQQASLRTARVLPLEIGLWNTALEWRQLEDQLSF